MSGNTALEVVIALSIFVPLIVVAAVAWFFLRGARNNPDEIRLKRVQAEANRARRAHERGRP